MRQNNINMLLGIGAIAGILFGMYGLSKANSALNAYNVAVDSVSHKVAIDPPAAVIQAATEKAVNGAIDVIAKAELTEAKRSIAEAATKHVATAVEEATKTIDLSAPELKDQIVKNAGEKVGNFVMNKLKATNFGNLTPKEEGVADIIRAAKEAGMSSWDIQRVLEASKK